MKRCIVFCLFCIQSSICAADIISDTNRLFDWAETRYPQLFSPGGAASFQLQNYYLRYYAQTQTYMGTQGSSVYVYGDIFNGLLYVGEMSALMPEVDGAGMNVNISEYLPLQVGNRWNLVEYYTGEAPQFSSHQIIGTEQVNGLTAFQDAYFENGNELVEATLLAYQDGNLLYVGERQYVQDGVMLPGLYQFNPALSFSLNLTVGDQFSGNSSLIIPQGASFDLSWSFKLLAHVDRVELGSGGGYDDCISFILSLTSFDESSQDMIWLCKGIGEIKSVDTLNGDSEELLDFSLLQ